MDSHIFLPNELGAEMVLAGGYYQLNFKKIVMDVMEKKVVLYVCMYESSLIGLYRSKLAL